MQRYARLVAALTAVLLIAAACGGEEDAAEAPDADEAADGEQVTLTFWDNQQADTGLSEFQQTAVEEFEAAHPNINIEIETVPYADYQ